MLFLLGSIIIKTVKSKSFFVSKWWLYINKKKNYIFQRFFELKLLNGCRFEIKKAFDLKIFMMIDPNKKNINPEFYKILPIR
jgi:hypothetical protein